MLIRGLWEIQKDAIVDVRFVDADAETYVKEGMGTILPRWEKTKKENHGRNFHEQRKNSLLIISVDEMMGREAQVVLAALS